MHAASSWLPRLTYFNVQFAGDAVSIVWMIDGEPGAPRDLREATLWATGCACEIHRVRE